MDKTIYDRVAVVNDYLAKKGKIGRMFVDESKTQTLMLDLGNHGTIGISIGGKDILNGTTAILLMQLSKEALRELRDVADKILQEVK